MAELILNTNTITDMGELARLAYLEYGTSIKIGDEYFPRSQAIAWECIHVKRKWGQATLENGDRLLYDKIFHF